MKFPHDIRYEVFISSTKRDLEKERAAVSETLLRAGYLPKGMELFPSTNPKSLAIIKNSIELADYFVVIVGGRYGSTLPNGMSFTEFEYRHANRHGKKPLVFLSNQPRGNEVPSDEPLEKRQRLEKFVELLLKRHNIMHFTSPDDLGARVLTSLAQHVSLNPAAGLIRGDAPGILRVQHDLDTRVQSYKILRASAKKSIFVVGIGMRHIVSDELSILEQLNRGIAVRMMCLEPSFIRATGAENLFNQFFALKDHPLSSADYLSAIEGAIGRLEKLIAGAEARNAAGSIELRTYSYFPSTNMTCVDESGADGRMVLELVAQGNQRLTLPGLTRKNPLYVNFYRHFETTWEGAKVRARNR